MLDTNTVSCILKGKSPAARTRLASLRPNEVVCISIITEAELLYGLAKAGSGEQRRKALAWFLGRMQVLSWGREEAAAYGTLRAKQEALGRTLGALDMQIAAQALARGAIVVTGDKAFQHVAELPGVESWTTDL
jgi:tRNA(fMet)-specific endonuclease VapC